MTSSPPALLPNSKLAGGARRVAQRACIVHFVCGDSIGSSWGLRSKFTTGDYAPPGAFIWGQNSLAYLGTRFSQTPTAGVGLLPYGPGHGLSGPADTTRSMDLGALIAPALVASTTPKGGGPWSGPDHVFASVTATSANMSPTGAGTVSFAVGNNLNNSLVDAHAIPMLAALPPLYPGGVYLGALNCISFGGDASETGEGAGETGSAAAFTANFTAFVNDFRTQIGATSATLPVHLGRVPSISGAVTNQSEHAALQTAQDNSGGTNGITTIDCDSEDRWGPDGVHRTQRGYGIISGEFVAAYGAIPSFSRWTGF